jgi:cardiolipin hydrolase
MVKYISMAKKSIDLAIFSFTNDDLANEILAAHERGVTVRIISDDEAMKGKGADTQRMADAGIPCRTDNEEKYHMHNKFMLVDQLYLVTGSFNWTFQAGANNQENVVVLDGKYYIDKYHTEFCNLWGQFSKNKVEQQEHKAAATI